MDNADIAEDRIQNVRDGGIAIATKKTERLRALEPCGECYYCSHPLNKGFVFCADQDCMIDYYHEIDRDKANGR